MAKENEEAMRKLLDFTNVIGIVFYILNLIYFCMGLWKEIFPEDIMLKVEEIAFYVQNRTGVFSIPYITLFIAIVFIGLHGWAERGKRSMNYHQPFFTKPFSDLFEAMNIFVRPPINEDFNKDVSGNNKKKVSRVREEGYCFVVLGLFFILLSPILLKIPSMVLGSLLYILISLLGVFYFLFGCNYIHRMYSNLLDNDEKNDIQESFKQNEEYIENEYSVNLRTQYFYKGEERNGWINVVNPFRATQVLGTPGSGKSFAVINEFIRQHLRKNFAMYCYDFKFPDLSMIVYNHFLWNLDGYKEKYGIVPRFCVINFDDPRKSLRCNPILSSSLNEITDAYDAAYTIMLNLNKSWAQKQGDFFVESPINYLTASIWYLKEIEGGKYCTLPHVIEWINSKYGDCIPLMSMNASLNSYMSAFMEAWEGGAQDQLQGQIASVRIPLSRISSPQLYWVMSGNDFTLDINNPESPKILCVGNNPEKKDIYATALGLYNGRIVKVINKKGKHKVSLIIDELPTMFFKGLDNLIATARSNKVSVCLGYQDYTQLIRDYGDKEAKAIINTIGNLFSGQVTGDTANNLEKRFGRNKQKKASHSFSENGLSTSISEQNDTMIPASKISTLSQGTFVGAVADNVGEEQSEKIFHSKILIDVNAVKQEEKAYKPLPTFYSFDTPKVVADIKNHLLSFIEDVDNYIIAKKFSDGDDIVSDNFSEEIKRVCKIDDVKEFIFETFRGDSGKDKVLESISQIGKSISNQIDRFRDELLSQTQIDVESFGSALKSLMENKYVSLWVKQEKSNLSELRKLGVSHIFVIVLKHISKVVSNEEMSLSKKRDSITSYLRASEDYFRRIMELKSDMQKIRDAQMKEVLHHQEEKIRNDIKGLIERQLEILNTDPRFEDLSARRAKAIDG